MGEARQTDTIWPAMHGQKSEAVENRMRLGCDNVGATLFSVVTIDMYLYLDSAR